jgi:hypothetical protein
LDDSEAWNSALRSLPELLGQADLPKLNEGLRYLFKELREAQATFMAGSDLDGVYLSLVAVLRFPEFVPDRGRRRPYGASYGVGERVVGARRRGH